MRFPILIVFSFVISSLSAQTGERCGTMNADSILRSKVPGSPTLIDFEGWLQLKMNEVNASAQRGAIVTIPVIVHVIHDGDAVGTGQNLSQAQVMSQFDVLNEDFRRLNADAGNTPSAFLPVAADIEIEFCPAVVDPNGNVLAEPGINRVNAGQATWDDSDIDISLKPSTIWDPSRYFNIWTVNFSSSTLLGYAQFPEGSGLAGMPGGAQAANTDGIVCRYNAFGRVGNVTAPYNLGRTATHETGHWLGLRHIWGDGGCTEDDFCGDTPESDGANNGCLTGYVSCGNVNMVQNYMDYSNDACMNIFTLCQKTRMRTVLQNSPRRLELLSSTVCIVLNSYNVTGQIRDAQTLQGVPFAKVRFKNNSYNYTANCDANGNFIINNVFEGTYDVYGGKWGYVTATVTANVQAGMQPVIVSVNKGYYDDFVLDFAWNVAGSATAGIWERAQPVGTTFNGVASNPGTDVTNDFGTECFTTGNGGGAAGTDDVDNGNTVLTSPVFDLTTYNEPYLKFYRWFYNDGGTGTPNDQLVIRISNGVTTATIETLVYNTPNANQWNFRNLRIEDYVALTANMQFVLETGDLAASGHLVEAGLDLFRLTDSLSAPQANFLANQTSGCVPLTVNFSDISSGTPNAWQWTFPGGTPATSAAQNPTVVYSTAGMFNVTLTVTNAAGNNTITYNNFITVYTNPQITSTTSIDARCFGGNDGTGFVGIFQGTPPYTVTWSDGQTGLARSNLSAGNYTATVIDAHGCRDTSTIITIGQPAAALTLTTSSTPEHCSNQDGTATVTPAGGTSPYTIHWSNNGNLPGIFSLTGGQYSVTVTDTKNCQATASVNVAANNEGPLLTLTATNISCFGLSDGAITSTVSGGTASYAFNWSTGANTADLTALPAGSYTLTATDANGCVAIQSHPVTQPTVLSISDSVTNASCGLSNGSITLSVSGGSSPYTYAWNNGNTNANRTNLAAATYRVTVTDNNNCTATRSITVGQTTSLSVTDAVTNTSCGINNGTITLTATGGALPFIYLWNDGNTNADRTGLAAGTYTVTVTDANNCSVAQTSTITQSTIVSLNNSITNASCGLDNGAITLSASNGTAPYTYLWDNGDTTATRANLIAGSYLVTVTDNNGCFATQTINVSSSAPVTVTTIVIHPRCGIHNGIISFTQAGGNYSYAWSTGDTVSTLAGLDAGNYTVTITDDDNGCTRNETFTITQTDGVQFEFTKMDASCFGVNDGSISVQVLAGTPPFSYVWSTNDVGQTLIAGAGAYAVLVTDSIGCTAVGDTVINQPLPLLLAVQSDDLVCSDKVVLATATISGGTSPYSYTWDSEPDGDSVYLADGSHTALVTDLNGCTATDSFFVTALPEPQYTLQSTPDTANRSTGTATAGIISGVAPFSFAWSNAQTDSALTGLTAGTYYVTITDGNGCEVQDSVVVDATVNVTHIGNLELAIYPNPNDGVFNIQLNNNVLVRVEGYNAIGEKIFSLEKLTAPLTTIDVRQHGRGVYFIRIFVEDGVVVRKVVYE